MCPLPTHTRVVNETYDDFMVRMHRHFEGTPLTMPNMLHRSVTRFSTKTALMDLQNRLTYQEVWEAVCRLGAALKAHLEAPKGERVALIMRSHVSYVLSYFAVLHQGAVVVPLNVRLAPREIAYILENSEAKTVIADTEFRDVLSSAVSDYPDVRIVWNGESDEGLTLGEWMKSPPTDPDPSLISDDPAAIYYTSGTTGFPKGAVITHSNMVCVGRQNVEAWCFDTPDVVQLVISPLFHVSFQEFGPPVLHVGGTLIVDTFSPRRSLEIIQNEGINSFFAVPSMLFMMGSLLDSGKSFDTSSVKLVHYGGAPMPVERLEAVQRWFPNAVLIQGFGQTESCGMITVTLPEETVQFPRSTGRAISGCRIRVVDDNDRDLPVGSVGEILAQGPQIMEGYYQTPEANEETLRNGWLHTGDVGYLDEEGRLYVLDRKKDLIIRGGQNVYAAEVEEVLYEHPVVAEAAVVGKPDAILGEEVVAFIISRPGQTVDAEDILRLAREKLASYKVPKEITFVEDFPRTSSGKIKKFELRALFTNREE